MSDPSRASETATACVMCVLSDDQRAEYESELSAMSRPGVTWHFESCADDALDRIGQLRPALVIVGMSLGPTEGLEFVALLFRRHRDFTGKVVVLPNKGDPFPPMLQMRDATTGRSTTVQTDLAGIDELVEGLVPAASPEPVPQAELMVPQIGLGNAPRLRPAATPIRLSATVAVDGQSGSSAPAAQAGAQTSSAAAPPGIGIGTRERFAQVEPRDQQAPSAADAPAVSAAAAPAGDAPAAAPAPPARPARAASAPNQQGAAELPRPAESPAANAAAEAGTAAAVPPVTQQLGAAGLGGAAAGAGQLPSPAMAASAAAGVSAAPAKGQPAAARKWIAAAVAVVLLAAAGAGGLIWLVLMRSSEPLPAVTPTPSAAPGPSAPSTQAPPPALDTPRPRAGAQPEAADSAAAEQPSAAQLDLRQPVTLPLSFEKGRFDYTVADYAKLGSIVSALHSALQADADARVEVGGHASREGGDALNRDLGYARAAQLAKYLVDQGIPAGRILARSFGESKPVAPETDAASNRRVTVRLVD
jgi:outer membrane protein OmpA-like peptidoglycan-associated protein